MESSAKFLGHPIHQMLVAFPLGLLGTSVIFDGLFLLEGGDQWADRAYILILAGIIGGVTASIFGTIDWLAIPSKTRAKRVGAVHGLGNVIVLVFFAGSFFVRLNTIDHLPNAIALSFSVIAFLLTGLTAWLGGELVTRLGVGVDEDAHLDAKSSFQTEIRVRKI